MLPPTRLKWPDLAIRAFSEYYINAKKKKKKWARPRGAGKAEILAWRVNTTSHSRLGSKNHNTGRWDGNVAFKSTLPSFFSHIYWYVIVGFLLHKHHVMYVCMYKQKSSTYSISDQSWLGTTTEGSVFRLWFLMSVGGGWAKVQVMYLGREYYVYPAWAYPHPHSAGSSAPRARGRWSFL